MPDEQHTLMHPKLKTPRAAALAGILFAVLFIISVVLIRFSIPADPADSGAWLKYRAGIVSLALSLLPFSGIAFLWFMGVVRDRIGHLEDQFFSTVFFGSGLLFLAMTFASASLAGGALATYAVESSRLIESGVYTFVRAVTYRINNVYAVKMAGVFMISLGTIWVRTRVMPRWLALLTYVLALGLLLSIGSSLWVTLIFPAWVCAVSVYILVLNPRGPSASQQGGLE
ncbi:MAG: hypothetical protein ACREOW_02720 [Thermodesulfobacteriota bacterium]